MRKISPGSRPVCAMQHDLAPKENDRAKPEAPNIRKFSLIAGQGPVRRKNHEGARLRCDQESGVGVVPLAEKPLEQLIVGEAGNPVRALDRFAKAVAMRALPPENSAIVRASTCER